MDRKLQKEILKWLLGQAYRAESHKKQLERRLARIRQEVDNPVGAIRYSSMPKAAATGNRMEDLVADLTEIESEIMAQIKAVSGAKRQVMEIIDFIPVHETARQIFELRHIDFLDWYAVSEEIHMSRQQCAKYHREGLDILIGYPEIQKKVELAKPDYENWKARKNKVGI
ncbi:MAG: hypothetical protein LUC83_11175 [Clostridiales bacterium]|nr:hypothetical protein [Clostridiales bacterium]